MRKPQEAPFAQLLLEHGANPNARASFREPLNGHTFRDHHNITPLAWGDGFHNRIVVSEPAMQLIAEHRGHR